MNTQSRAPEQALTILAVATVVVGFGLFTGDFFSGGIGLDSLAGRISGAKFFIALMVMYHYARGFVSTREILMRDQEATGRDVADGPLAALAWQVLFVVVIFVLNVSEESLRG